jgi:hypothetical protein
MKISHRAAARLSTIIRCGMTLADTHGACRF